MDEHPDVWKPAADLSAGGSREGSVEARGEAGVPLRQALSLGTVLGRGWAVLRDYPVLSVGTSVLLWLLGAFPGLISSVLIALGLVDPNSLDPTELMANMGLQLGVATLSLALMPVIFWVYAGTMRALAHAVEHDEARWSLVVSSWRPALWLLLLYAVLYTALMVVVVVLALVSVVVSVLVGVGVELLAPGALPAEWVVVGVMGLLFLPLVLGLVWGALTVLPMVLAITVEGRDPLEAARQGWRSVRGARWSLLLMLLPMVGVLTLAMGLVVSVQLLIGPGAALAATLGLAPVGIAVNSVYRGGLTAGWLLHVRTRTEAGGWSLFQRHPCSWLQR